MRVRTAATGAACALAILLLAGSAAAQPGDAVPELRLDPDPPLAGVPFTVEIDLGDPDVANATLKACTYDRAAERAIVCLVPSAMEPLGEGRFRGRTDARGSAIFEAGGSVGVNVSYAGSRPEGGGFSGDFPGDGREYVVYGVAENPDLARPASAAGAALALVGIGIVGFAAGRWRA